MTRKKTGRVMPPTFAQRITAEIGESVLSVESAGKALGVGPELLIGLAQRGHIRAISREGDMGRFYWFIPAAELESLRARIQPKEAV